MLKKWLTFLLGVLLIPLFTARAAAETQLVPKNVLLYEILDINMNDKRIAVKGWALMNEVQHFTNGNDHQVQLELKSPKHSFIVDASLLPISQTATMKFGGTSRCADNALYQAGRACWYDFENVGFQAEIPLTALQMDTSYTVYLIVHSKTAGFSGKIPIYYPIKEDIVQKNKEFVYRAVSKLYDTQLTVNATTVMARNAPSKTADAWQIGDYCSSSFKNRLYFLENSRYSSIYNKTLNNNSSYYEVAGQLAGCLESRRRIEEGRAVSPVWIASNFVDYSGTPLLIKTSIENSLPVLTIKKNPEIMKGDTINPFDYVEAYDQEEGNLTSKIQLISGHWSNTVSGVYSLTFQVVDQYGASDIKTMTITVKEPPNNPPLILAEDQTIKQFSSFHALDYAKANDIEDGDLTSKIQAVNEIDTAVLGLQQQCYTVKDSKGAQANRCIIITVLAREADSVIIRFVDRHKPFFKQNIPQMWNQFEEKLIEQLNNEIVYEHFELQ